MRAPRVAGVVLAAGASQRTGFPKALATLDGRPLVRRSAETLQEGGCASVLIVAARPHEQRVRDVLEPDFAVVQNPAPEDGMSGSLIVALAHAQVRSADALIFSLVDHPRVAARTVGRLIDAFHEVAAREECARVVLRPVYRERGGHPTLISRALFDYLETHPSGESLRPVLRAHRRDVHVDDPFVLEDWDDLQSLREAGAAPPCDPDHALRISRRLMP